FYIRIRTLPTAQTTFWRLRKTTQANVGAALDITPSGQIALSWVNNAGGLNLLGTSTALALDTWYRIDVLTELIWDTGTHVNGIIINVFQNGLSAVFGTRTDTGSITGTDTDRINNSEIGTLTGNTLAMDIDDWHGCSAHPATAPPDAAGIDWINGSAILPISATGFDASTTGGAWTGDWRNLLQDPPDDGIGAVTGATNAAALVLNTDALDVISAQPGSIGAVAINVAIKATTVQA